MSTNRPRLPFLVHASFSTQLALVALPAALPLVSFTAPAFAQAEDKQRQEARERFDRGLRLFNAGDNTGALAEFQRAYDITQHPVVLFNLALVYQSMRQPVQAADALTKLLANPGQLDAERLARSRSILAEQQALIGYIKIVSEQPNAAVEIDNLQVATTPVAKPIPVPSGSHVVSLILPGFFPLRQQLTVPGQSTVEFSGSLKPLEGRLAHLEINSPLVGASVRVNGELLGKTPLPASLALAPGEHTVELSRPGYVSQKKVLKLGDGASGTLSLDPPVDPSALATHSGYLELALSEPQAVIFIDQRPLGTYSAAMRLPEGPHRLRVERASFFPYERDIEIPKGGSTRLSIELQPTTEYRAAYAERTHSQRTWGWVSVGSGAVLMAGSTGYLIWNSSQVSDAQQKFDALVERGSCRDRIGMQDVCETELNLAFTRLDDAQSQTKFGWIGMGVGAAATGFGAFLLLSNDDPNRYEPKADSDVFGSLRATPVAWAIPGAWGAGVVGSF